MGRTVCPRNGWRPKGSIGGEEDELFHEARNAECGFSGEMVDATEFGSSRAGRSQVARGRGADRYITR